VTTILDRLAASAAGADAATNERVAQELESIRARFKQAPRISTGARFASPDGKGREIEELPWYVIIGAPGSGKNHGADQFRPALPPVRPGEHALHTGRRRHAQLRLVVLGRGGAARPPPAATPRRTAIAGPTPPPGRGCLSHAEAGAAPPRPLNGVLVTVSVMDLLL